MSYSAPRLSKAICDKVIILVFRSFILHVYLFRFILIIQNQERSSTLTNKWHFYLNLNGIFINYREGSVAGVPQVDVTLGNGFVFQDQLSRLNLAKGRKSQCMSLGHFHCSKFPIRIM